ncbi:MAG: phosphate/phosphite/phosphonate ABC transporter substrate-binding protein [Desulfobulbaceae bacterium]|nr:phosphate/phosphite/phosphonate ABC transporter substrate-binding protein [Desulfobulbaceae bacterium]
MRNKPGDPISVRLSVLISALLLLFSFPTFAAGQEKITIGLLPEMNVFKQKKRFEPLAEYLSTRMKVKVELSMLSRYGNIIERFKEVNIDAAFLGSFTGALAISQLGVEPIARPINEDGASTYCGYLFTRKDSGITTVADMKGKTFAFVEKATTAGYVFPLAYLKRHQVINLDDYFKAYYFTGSHDAAIEAVLNGRADVGATKNTIYNFVRKTDPRLDSELVILATSPKVPSNGLCVKPEMASATKERLRQELLTLHLSQEGLVVLKSLGFQRFAKTSKEDYQPVFELSEEAGINLKEYRYVNE